MPVSKTSCRGICATVSAASEPASRTTAPAGSWLEIADSSAALAALNEPTAMHPSGEHFSKRLRRGCNEVSARSTADSGAVRPVRTPSTSSQNPSKAEGENPSFAAALESRARTAGRSNLASRRARRSWVALEGRNAPMPRTAGDSPGFRALASTSRARSFIASASSSVRPRETASESPPGTPNRFITSSYSARV